ncbi:MAG: transglycosylase SLT domain-containing protein [Bacillota bacterium]|nr:transglycosylase SLT domain-containing protein [Bacillota bacterium]
MKTKEEAYLKIILVTFSILIWNWNINQIKVQDFADRISSTTVSVNLQKKDSSISGEAEFLERIAVEAEQSPYETVICEVFKNECDIAVAVAKAESNLNPEVIGDRHLAKPSIGLFQINQIWHDYSTEDLMNPEFNIKIAKQIRDSGGWERWTTYRTGAYLNFLES